MDRTDTAAGVAETAKGPRARVLVVEDSRTNQQLALGLLEYLGCQGEVAANGTIALPMLDAAVYDLIFMDCQMPEMDGYETTRQIRLRAPSCPGTGPKVPIVGLTADAFAEDRERCLSAGMDDYLSKPIEFDQLAQVIERWVPRR